jgi:hypothetical protein
VQSTNFSHYLVRRQARERDQETLNATSTKGEPTPDAATQWLSSSERRRLNSRDAVALSHEELSLLVGGIDLTRTRRKDWYRKTVAESEKV